MSSTGIVTLLLLALPACTWAYPARLNRALSSYTVGGPGPMDITQLQAGNAGTCAINAAAANGYTPGQVYTIQMTATGEHAFEPSAGTVTGNKYNQPSYQWTAPSTATPVTFRALCATGRGAGSLTSTIVQSGGGGQQGGGQQGGGQQGGGQAPGGLLLPTEALTITKIEKVITSGLPNPPISYECCGLDAGTLTVSAGSSSGGVSTVRVTGTVTGQCEAGLGFTSLSLELNQQTLQASGTDTQFVSRLLGGPSILQLPAPAETGGRVSVEMALTGTTAETAVLTMTVTGEKGNPTICDASFTFKEEDAGSIQGSGAGAGGGEGGNAGTIVIVVLVLLVVIAGIGFYVKNSSGGGGSFAGGGGASNAKPVVAVAMSKPTGGGKLKPNWNATQDAEGDTYYYNSVSGETTWEKDLVQA